MESRREWFKDPEEVDHDNDALVALNAEVEHANNQRLLALFQASTHRTYQRDGATSLTPWLQRRLTMTPRQARTTARLIGLLHRLPTLTHALQRDAITTHHIEALDRHITHAHLEHLADYETQLLAHAVNLNAHQFEHICRRLAELLDEHHHQPTASEAGWLQLAPTLFGELDIRGHLTADQAATVTQALNHLNTPDPTNAPIQRSVRERNADALTDLAHHYLNQPPTKDTNNGGDVARRPSRRRPGRPTAAITLDLDTYLDQTRVLTLRGPGGDIIEQPDLAAIRCQLTAGGPIPRNIADLFLCDANIQRLVLDPAGQPLNIGRPTPTITTAQRTALTIRDQGCVFPTCDRPAHWCDAHHLEPRSRGGPTNIDNLALLCRHHHRSVHTTNWQLERKPDGTITATRRDGRTYQRQPDGHLTTT